MSNTFRYDEDFENRLLAFLIRKKDFFRKHSHLVKEQYFENQIRRDLYHLAKEYHEKYPDDDFPANILRNEVYTFYHKVAKHSIPIEDYQTAIEDYYVMDLESGEQYTADQLAYFAQRQEVKNVILDARDRVMTDGRLDDIPGNMIKALQAGQIITTRPTLGDIGRMNLKIEWAVEAQSGLLSQNRLLLCLVVCGV